MKPIDLFQVSADVRWINWSETQDQITVKLENSTNPDVNAALGSDSVTTTLDLGWEDQYVYAVGLEVYPLEWLTLRLGYNYGKSPVPESSVSPQFPALTEHHACIGFSLNFDWIEFHFAFTHDPRVSKSSTDNAITGDFDNSETSFELNIVSFGFTLRY